MLEYVERKNKQRERFTDRERMAWTTWRVKRGLSSEGSMLYRLLIIAGRMMCVAETSREALKMDEEMFIWSSRRKEGRWLLYSRRGATEPTHWSVEDAEAACTR
jgi:hypothetical protein